MASSVWSTVQGTVVPSSLTSVVTTSSASSNTDPTALLHQQLASALSTVGDAQFWEETISPSTIRTSLASSDPSNPNSTPALLRGMKWLLASISKGRDVSDFYPHVVKLVGASSLEVRKMVYVYLVQYADHDSTTRELSLLSINSFQRGLADSEPWIRALALRVLTSIRIPDILQIQILGVQTCAKDRSPYVRKCAANALAKLYSRCDSTAQRDMLLEIMIQLLEEDTATMVLTSAIIAFSELCPERLVLLHNPYRKICHLLTDMDEWGQVVVLDLMARYCRKFFKKPQAWKDGTAEQIDRDRRVRRTITGIASVEDSIMTSSNDVNSNAGASNLLTESYNGGAAVPTPKSPKKIKRRVIKKGFYSDEEDESTEEEVDTRPPLSAFRQPNVLQPGIGHQGMPALATNNVGDEDLDVDEDHRLLLRSSLPLLKSRNAAVVMAVCSLHYYCGVSSVKIRSAMGKALVRIHRDRREIQYVVLTSIRTLVQQCPSAFGPFLNDFFVKAMDPPFTRIIKLEILTALALEPVAIEGVLKELRSYIRSSDKMFVCAAIRAVGKVVELARIVYDRHGAKHGQVVQQRKEANRIALDCLFGLNTLTQASDYVDVIGECAMVMQRIILQLMSDATVAPVEDPNGVLGAALRRIILLLTRSLSSRSAAAATDPSAEDTEEKVPTALEQVVLPLGPVATASLLWIFGEWVAPIRSSSPVLRVANMSDKSKSKIKLEVLRLVAHAYPELQAFEKEQGIHLASKMLVAAAVNKNAASGDGDVKLVRCCELLLSMGRVDVNPIVRDRARYESLLLDSTVGLKHDREGLEGATAPPKNKDHPLTMDDLNRMLLASKPAPSHLPLDDDDGDDATIGGETTTTHFRFGTLSSLVGHKAGAAYLALPPWADKNSPASLRDGSSVTKSSAGKTAKTTNASGDDWQVDPSKNADGFYESSEEDDSNDGDEEEDSDESEDDSDDSDDEEEESDDDSDEDESDSNEEQKKKGNANNVSLLLPMAAPTFSQHPVTNGTSSFSAAPKAAAPVVAKTIVDSDDDDDDSSSSSEDDSSDDEESSDDARPPKPATSTTKEGNLLGMLGPTTPSVNSFMPASSAPKASSSSATKYTSVAEDLSGLVMAPLDLRVPNLEQDTSAWTQLVRPSVSGGLDLQVRFLRGPSKEQEARRLGLNPEHAGTVCLQVRLENIKSDSTVLRRIRLLQKSSANSSSSTSSTVLPRKVVLPNEVASLAPQQVVLELLGLEFVTVPDRDGSCLVKLELKHGSSGGIPIDWKIPLAELLRRSTMTQSLVTVATFDAGMQRLQGFQRVSSSISLPAANNDTDDEQRREQILRAVLSHAALVPVAATNASSSSAVSTTTATPNHYWSLNNQQLRLVASLPGSGDPVFVSVTLTAPSVQLTVCCDNALALNSLVDVLKRAILQSSSNDAAASTK